MTNADFERMIPEHFISGGKSNKIQIEPATIQDGGASSVVVTVQKSVPDVPMLPPAPTELGRVTETITKSTLTETVMTRVTDNRLMEPLISEVIILLLKKKYKKKLHTKITHRLALLFSCCCWCSLTFLHKKKYKQTTVCLQSNKQKT